MGSIIVCWKEEVSHVTVLIDLLRISSIALNHSYCFLNWALVQFPELINPQFSERFSSEVLLLRGLESTLAWSRASYASILD